MTKKNVWVSRSIKFSSIESISTKILGMLSKDNKSYTRSSKLPMTNFIKQLFDDGLKNHVIAFEISLYLCDKGYYDKDDYKQIEIFNIIESVL